MDRAAARDHDGGRSGFVADQYGRRTWRRIRPLQPARRGRDRLRVRLVGGGIGRSSRRVTVGEQRLGREVDESTQSRRHKSVGGPKNAELAGIDEIIVKNGTQTAIAQGFPCQEIRHVGNAQSRNRRAAQSFHVVAGQWRGTTEGINPLCFGETPYLELSGGGKTKAKAIVLLQIVGEPRRAAALQIGWRRAKNEMKWAKPA